MSKNKTTDLEKKIAEFDEFMESLTELDLSNFKTLLSLPSATKVAAQMEDCKYKDMLIFGLAMKSLAERQGEK